MTVCLFQQVKHIIEAVSDRPVYHNYRDRSIGVFDQFVILWSGRDGGNLAIFVIRTVNAPQEEATFRLYKDEGGSEILLVQKPFRSLKNRCHL